MRDIPKLDLPNRNSANSALKDTIDLVAQILKKGNDVEIRSCREGYKVLEVVRSPQMILTDKNTNTF